jgi:hypothetical protein
MERDDVKRLIAINRTAFPNFYNNMGAEDLAVLVNTWFAMFTKYEKQVIESAFMQALANAKYPVVPANVFEIIKAQSKANQPTTDELFDMAEKAGWQIDRLYNPDIGWETEYDYDTREFKVVGLKKANEIYNKLPPILREWKHSPMELLRWVNTLTDENDSYVRHQFKDIMGDRLNRREALGLDFNSEFNPRWDAMLGCMKSIDENGKVIGGATKLLNEGETKK